MELVNIDTSGYLIFFLLCSGPYIVGASKDLALKQTATQSSTYIAEYSADRAVDGVLGVDVSDGHCSHTGSGHQQAWWKVDLGQIYRIQTINITYRRSQTARLKGYSLYVTNNTAMTQSDGSINEQLGYLCYHDADSRTPTYNQSRQCHVDGRYVVFYNHRTYGDAYIELCGVQVYGCPTGRFGFNCSDTCHCQTGGCNPDTGQCNVTGCQAGWMGLSCSLRCHCNLGRACDIDTGACSGGCQSGWSGRSCMVGPHKWNLAYNKYTRQSTTNGVYRSDIAVDGVITADAGRHGSCSHTCPEGHDEAWWYVDLGGEKRIGIINIIYRQNYPFRMSGFYLYISNSSYTNSQALSRDVLCYHDHGPGLPSYIQSLSCPVSGRYVIFYNKRPADYEPFNRTFYSESNAVIELCEVQVLGACERGKFGQDCSQSCHCASSDCNQMTGTCLVPRCSAGWMGNSCDQACERGKFGQDCSKSCHCASPDCHQMTGTCLVPGCSAGWMGNSCDQACERGKFGQDCSKSCHCASPDCHQMTGTCLVPGCSAGWMGNSCDQVCERGKFGQNCSQSCHCATSDCHKMTGECLILGCSTGWMGNSCDQGRTVSVLYLAVGKDGWVAHVAKRVPAKCLDETVTKPVIVLTLTVTGGVGYVVYQDVLKVGQGVPAVKNVAAIHLDETVTRPVTVPTLTVTGGVGHAPYMDVRKVGWEVNAIK
ncbi:multiple epidermal growth factor-like domains protein 10, partial [Ylistrum balloti]|uniref:multiple epidermal growth factor-like domains protein 10 n=1 Tax=Ylistrum balloti TaxID=509963 RepID=UPI002905D255